MTDRKNDQERSGDNISQSYDESLTDEAMQQYSSSQAIHLEEENRLLKSSLERLKRQIAKISEPPLLVAELKELHPENKATIRLNNGNEFFVNVMEDCTDDIKAGDNVLVDQKNLNVVKPVHTTNKFNIDQFIIIEKPEFTWKDVGGLEHEIQEVKEVVELPLQKPQLFTKIGIQPPKGILLYGPPGTGKTLLAKAVANSTNSTFIEIVGSELVQKFIGEGAKLIKEIFEVARSKAPAIIFIDELDALAATRVEIGTSGEREVQRTFMQLLAEIDGFNHLDNVKIVGCTNREDILDPAITRPGRLDRMIKVDHPNKEGIMQIFKIHTRNMKLSKSVKLEQLYTQMEGLSGAEVKAVCTEAGYFAIRKNRTQITHKDFLSAIEKVKREEKTEGNNYLNMFH
jgi:proteasome regulatory subunit